MIILEEVSAGLDGLLDYKTIDFIFKKLCLVSFMILVFFRLAKLVCTPTKPHSIIFIAFYEQMGEIALRIFKR